MHTRNQLVSILAILLSLLGGSVSQGATTETSAPISVGIESDVVSRYVWRGISYSERAVWQPSFSIDAYGFGFSIWTNLPFTDETAQGRFNEFDYTLSYTQSWYRLEITPSLILYTYPESADPDTAEVGLKITHPLGPISLFADTFFDIVEYDGASFLDVGMTTTHEFTPKLTTTATVLFGIGNGKFNETYLANVGTTTNVVAASLSLAWTQWRDLVIAPHLDVSTLLDPTLRNAVEAPTLISGGLKIGYDF